VAVDVRRGENGSARQTPLFYTYEEYRLDALGRRVLVRADKSCEYYVDDRICSMSSVRRTVWAGDRELYEIQMPDTHGENDTADPPTQPLFEGFDPNPFWGRVAYTYGGPIDQPLSIVRMGYKDYYNTTTGIQVWPEFAIIPHWNANGQAQTGTFQDGGEKRCRANYPDWCVKLEWEAGLFPYSPGARVPEHWHGTLMGEKRDASGLLYRRNRYYDPATGRFTQEDPIGLAGGINVYGFAAGDPVSYSDPYGLKMECKTQEACDLWNGLGRRVNAGLRSDDERVRKGAETLREIMNAVYYDPDVTYVIELSDVDDAFGGGRELDREEGGYLIQIDSNPGRDVSFTKPVVLAHELGGALRRQRGGFHWKGGPWGENGARRIAGCSLRIWEGGLFPPCHW
jgi:RHS repeat-associated protein